MMYCHHINVNVRIMSDITANFVKYGEGKKHCEYSESIYDYEESCDSIAKHIK